jgi:pyridoxine kinase
MKQILLINDIAGYSKVGMTAMMPILTYMGVPTYSLPTALVSNTLDYGKFNIQDTTDFIRGTLPVWKELGFSFDAICTGLMFSEAQAQLLARYCKEQAANGTTVFVDPVMGDGGRLYNGINDTNIKLMREMVAVADLIFPNYTEACYLTDNQFQQQGVSWDEARHLLDQLTAIGAKSAIITSCCIDGKNSVAGYNHYNQEYFHLEYNEIPGIYHGTGDIFSAVLIGDLLNGETLRHSTRHAMDAVARMIDRYKDVSDKNRGIPIERCLDLL